MTFELDGSEVDLIAEALRFFKDVAKEATDEGFVDQLVSVEGCDRVSRLLIKLVGTDEEPKWKLSN